MRVTTDPPADGFWTPGTPVLWVYDSQTQHPPMVYPVTVVQDDRDGLVVWLASDTPTLETVRTDGRDKRADKTTMFTDPRVQVRSHWHGAHNLRIAPAGRRWSVWCFFDADSGDFQGWYVNIEDPHRRAGHATITRDQILDVLVAPDRSHRRKDEDEMELAIPQCRLTPEQADDIRTVADEIEAVIDAWGSPFCDGWERFTPDPAWPVPGLPPTGWPPGAGLPPEIPGPSQG